MPVESKGVVLNPGATQVASGKLRARDVRFALQNVDIDPRVKTILCQQAEIIHILGSNLTETATQLNTVIDIVQQFADISQNMKDKMDRIQRSITPVDEGD